MLSVKFHLDRHGNVVTDKSANGAAEISNGLDNGRLAWYDLNRADAKELHRVAGTLRLHELSVEDAIKGRQRPKIESYGDHVFLVFYAVCTNDDDDLHLSEVAFFLGPHYLLTVHDEPLDVLNDVARRWNDATWSQQKDPLGLLVYAILDAIVDDYFPVIDWLGDRVEQLENDIISGRISDNRSEILSIRRNLQLMRRTISPERDVVNHLLRRDTPMFGQEIITNLGDVYDHLLRCYDWLDTYRDQLSTLLDLQAAAAANNLNKIMKTLTVSSIMLMTASLVAGVYGMNFDHMPELHWQYGYAFALALMVVFMGGLLLFFQHKRWL